TFSIAAEEATRLGGELLPLEVTEGTEGRSAIIRRFPVGVVFGISPFNFPLNLVAHKVAPALACGCPIIIKPASKTPISSLLLGEVVTNAGWPSGALNVVPCEIPFAEEVAKDGRVKKLTFTGSPRVGWMLKGKLAKKKVTLELGGNAGVIIHNDLTGAEFDFAVKRCVGGAFGYSGQVCISVQRIYVHKDIFAKFSERFVSATKALRTGDPMSEKVQIAPMINEASLKETEARVADALLQGGKLLAGGKRDGVFFEPTILTNTNTRMTACSEEAFAPLVTLEPYSEFEEAVKLVNDSPFGLQAGVFTRDIKNIFYAYENIEAGGVIAGDVPTFRTDNMPYGGVKDSGFGREGVKYAIEEMTEPRSLVLNLK
ncbi:MAG: aldehyde dehydrogenase family protein, partial [Deltaproteobacteria bacterium]|nr:aldehyde dehydrogenase family protein [Deltaproteobacteria bacterium]